MNETERLNLLEQRVGHVDATILRVDGKLDDISQALQTLVRIEERQILTGQRLGELAHLGTKNEERLRKVEDDIPKNLDERLGKIETSMPGLKEMRSWVIMGVLGGLGMMGAALAHSVLK